MAEAKPQSGGSDGDQGDAPEGSEREPDQPKDLAAQVIERLMPIEERVRCADQRWYQLRVTPYRTLDHSIKGALVVLVLADDNPPPSAGNGPGAALARPAGQNHGKDKAPRKRKA